MNNTVDWPIKSIGIVKNFFGLNIDIYEQTYGALSQDEHNPLSRVEVANSTFSLDPSRGCPLGCAYCVVGSSQRDLKVQGHTGDNPREFFIKKPEILFPGESVIKALVEHPAFIKDKSVLSISTASSEAFVPPNGEETWGILNFLAKNKYQNPVWIVTKFGIPIEEVEKWQKRFREVTSKGLRIIISVSYSNLPKEIEPYQADRFASIEKLMDSGVYLSHHLRPVIRKINDDEASIEKCLKRSLPIVKSVCVGGLRLDPGIVLAWKHANKLPTDILPSTPGVKDIPDDYMDRVKAKIKEMGFNTPVFARSSEVISNACGWNRDYNLNDYRGEAEEIFLRVPVSRQKEVAAQSGRTVIELIREAANDIGLQEISFWQQGEEFKVRQKLNYQENRALIHAIGHKQVL